MVSVYFTAPVYKIYFFKILLYLNALLLFFPCSYEPLHPWKIRVMEEDDSYTRAAHVFLRDLFQCNLEPHPENVAYMARSRWYRRWNAFLTSQCSPPTKRLKGTQYEVTQNHELREQQQNLEHEKQLLNNASQKLQKVVLQKSQQAVSSSRVGVDKRPSCDDASFVSDVCRRSSLHVAKVRLHHRPPL